MQDRLPPEDLTSDDFFVSPFEWFDEQCTFIGRNAVHGKVIVQDARIWTSPAGPKHKRVLNSKRRTFGEIGYNTHFIIAFLSFMMAEVACA